MDGKESLFDQCLNIKSEWDGYLNCGVINYVQNKVDTLKAAIKTVLNDCPEIWPLDLYETWEDFEPEEKHDMAFKDLNENLIMPINGEEVAEIIYYAKEFMNKTIRD